MIFTIELVQLWTYTGRHSSADSKLVRTAVAGAVISDVVCTASTLAIVYLVRLNTFICIHRANPPP